MRSVSTDTSASPCGDRTTRSITGDYEDRPATNRTQPPARSIGGIQTIPEQILEFRTLLADEQGSASTRRRVPEHQSTQSAHEVQVNTPTVTWRQTVAAAVAVVVALVGVVVLFSSDGLPAVNASASPATRWFVHRPTGYVVLVDGYGGRALARMDAESDGDQISVTEGGAVAYLLNDTSAEVTPIETADLQFGRAGRADCARRRPGGGRSRTGGTHRGEPRGWSGVDAPAHRRAPGLRGRLRVAARGRARRRGVDHRRPRPAADELDIVVGLRPRPRRRSDAVARRRRTTRARPDESAGAPR